MTMTEKRLILPLMILLFFVSFSAAEERPNTADHFRSFIATEPSEAAVFSLAQTIAAGDFAKLIPFIEMDASVIDMRRTRVAFVVLTQRSPVFRRELVHFVLNDLPVAEVSARSRGLLLSLIEYADQQGAKPVDVGVYQALARHRRIREAVELPQSLSKRIAVILKRQQEILAQQSPVIYIPAFVYAVAQERRIAPIDPDHAWRLTMIGVLCRRQSVLPLGIHDPALKQLRESLLETYRAGELPEKTKPAILNLLDHHFALWSHQFTSWEWRKQDREKKRFSNREAYQSELALRDTVQGLAGFLSDATIENYLKWIAITGGWGNVTVQDANIPDPLPAWTRQWGEAEGAGRLLKERLVEAVAPYSFIRLTNKLTDPGTPDKAFDLGAANLTSVPRVRTLSEELLTVAVRQGIVPVISFEQGAHILVSAKREGSLRSLFTQEHNARDKDAVVLHADHQRALRIVLAGFYQWRGDIEYRLAGPKPVGGTLSDRAVTDIRGFYDVALGLLTSDTGMAPESQSVPWTVGLGLFGRVLELERRDLIEECRMRQLQLTRGLDYTGDSMVWPGRNAENLLRAADAAIAYIKQLETTRNTDAERENLHTEVAIRASALARDENLFNAATSLVAAEQTVLSAVLLEQKQQDLRVKAARLRQSEAQYNAIAARAALAASTDEQRAAAVLVEAETFADDLIKQQIDTLTQNVAVLQDELPKLGNELTAAQESLGQFKQRAQDAHREREAASSGFWSSFGKIIKTIGSAVSVYFTGVDLVSIADAAHQAIRAASSNDWGAAIGSAFTAANKATGGKLEKAMTDQVRDSQLYLGSLMSDTLGGATIKLREATRVDGQMVLPVPDASQLATVLVGRQAVRIGVSYVGQPSNFERIMDKLAIPTNTEAGQRVRSQSQVIAEHATGLLEQALYASISRQGDRVLLQVAREFNVVDVVQAAEQQGGQIGNLAAHLQQALRQTVIARLKSDGAPEVNLISLIAKIQTSVPEADVTAAKMELLRTRDHVVRQLAVTAGVDTAKIDAAIDDLIAVSSAKAALPPAPLPREVRERLNTFRRHVEDARGKFSFLATPDAQRQVVEQLASSEDFEAQLDKTVAQLNDGINSAVAHFQSAAVDLTEVQNELDKLKLDQRQQQFKSEIATWKNSVAANLKNNRQALLEAAGESVLAAAQHEQIEKIAVEIGQLREQSQRKLIDARVGERDAAARSAEISRLELARAHRQLNKWFVFNAEASRDQKRAQDEAAAFYRDYVNKLLIQVWRLRSAYEASFAAQPAYAVPSLATLNDMRAAADAAIERWQTDLLELRRVLSSCSAAKLSAVLPTRIEQGIKTELRVLGYPALTLGREDLPRLRNGIRFSIAPLRDDRELNRGARSAIAASLAFSGVKPALRWNDHRTFRLRILGVALTYSNDTLKPGLVAFLNLTPETDGWISVRTEDGSRRLISMNLPSLENRDDGLGITLSADGFATGGLETRPLFGSYTIKIDADSLEAVDRDKFSAEICFVAVGVPQ